MRRFATISAVAALFVTAAAFAATEDFEWSGGSGAESLEISNVNGDINVTAGGDVIVVKATKTAATAEALKDVDVEVRESGTEVTVETEYRKRSKGERKIRVDFDVTVPGGVELAVATVNGDVTVTGVAAAKITTVNGGANVSEAYEEVNVSTVNGDAIIDNPAAPTGYVDVETVAGDVEAEVSLPDSDGDYVFSSVSGDITLTLSGNIGNYDVELESLSGDVKTELPLKKESGLVGTEYEGAAGAATNDISVSTVSGSITLKTK